MRILVVEDDADLAGILVEALEEEHYAVDAAREGGAADELLHVNDYDLVVLDWTLPGVSGVELLARWRGEELDVPVLMLTGRTDIEDRVGGLDAGADDYLTKPFSFTELFARVRSLLRRRERPMQPRQVGELKMDRARRRVTLAGTPLKLSPKEFAILEYLMARQGEGVSRGDLAEHAWDDSFDAMSNTIDVMVYRLRKKLDEGRDGKLLHTIKGVGYVLYEERR